MKKHWTEAGDVCGCIYSCARIKFHAQAFGNFSVVDGKSYCRNFPNFVEFLVKFVNFLVRKLWNELKKFEVMRIIINNETFEGFSEAIQDPIMIFIHFQFFLSGQLFSERIWANLLKKLSISTSKSPQLSHINPKGKQKKIKEEKKLFFS